MPKCPKQTKRANIGSKHDSFIHFTIKFNSKHYSLSFFSGTFNSKKYSITFSPENSNDPYFNALCPLTPHSRPGRKYSFFTPRLRSSLGLSVVIDISLPLPSRGFNNILTSNTQFNA